MYTCLIDTVCLGFFHVSQNLRKLGKYAAFLICISPFLQFLKCLIKNNTGYNFCIFNILRFQEVVKKKRKLDHRKITRYTIIFKNGITELYYGGWKDTLLYRFTYFLLYIFENHTENQTWSWIAALTHGWLGKYNYLYMVMLHICLHIYTTMLKICLNKKT